MDNNIKLALYQQTHFHANKLTQGEKKQQNTETCFEKKKKVSSVKMGCTCMALKRKITIYN